MRRSKPCRNTKGGDATIERKGSQIVNFEIIDRLKAELAEARGRLQVARENHETFKQLIATALDDAGAPTHVYAATPMSIPKPLTPQERIAALAEARREG